jgi:sec-independent protein translocase protein TatA
MFGMHWAELLIVLILATVIFGPKRIPEIGGALGKGIKDFRKGVTEMKEESGYNEVVSLPNDLQSAVNGPMNRGTSEAQSQQTHVREPVTTDTQASTPTSE